MSTILIQILLGSLLLIIICVLTIYLYKYKALYNDLVNIYNELIKKFNENSEKYDNIQFNKTELELKLKEQQNVADSLKQALTDVKKITDKNEYEKDQELKKITALFEKQKEKYEKETHLRKSSEVRLGKMAEHFMPFIDAYPYDSERFTFIGNPIDGIQINDDSIIFMEFKTGGARLSNSQKIIRDLIKEGKVYFESFRVNEAGPKLTRH